MDDLIIPTEALVLLTEYEVCDDPEERVDILSEMSVILIEHISDLQRFIASQGIDKEELVEFIEDGKQPTTIH